MARLIDADALKAEIERYADSEETKSITNTGGSIMSWEHRQVLMAITAMKSVFNIMDDMPTINVVLCKDCKWWEKQADSPQGRCFLNHTYPTGGWFCGNGRERREGDE